MTQLTAQLPGNKTSLPDKEQLERKSLPEEKGETFQSSSLKVTSLPDTITLSDYALPPDEIVSVAKESYEDLVSKGTVLRELQDSSQWAFGDLAYKVVRDLGDVRDAEGKVPLDRLAADIGERPGTLRQYRWVSMRFPNREVRTTNLSWSHYRHAAGTKEPESWINRAVSENLTSVQLREKIMESQDKISVEYGRPCDACGEKLPDQNAIHVRRGHTKTSFCVIACLLKYWTTQQSQGAI